MTMKLGSFKGDALQKLFLKTKHMEKKKKQMFGKKSSALLEQKLFKQ